VRAKRARHSEVLSRYSDVLRGTPGVLLACEKEGDSEGEKGSHTSRHSYFAAYPQPPCTHTHTQSQLTPRDCSDLVGAGWGDVGAASLSSLSHVDVNTVCLSFNPLFARTRACARSLPLALLSRALSLQPSLCSAPSRSLCFRVCGSCRHAYMHACI
jgi:hypothetical protein